MSDNETRTGVSPELASTIEKYKDVRSSGAGAGSLKEPMSEAQMQSRLRLPLHIYIALLQQHDDQIESIIDANRRPRGFSRNNYTVRQKIGDVSRAASELGQFVSRFDIADDAVMVRDWLAEVKEYDAYIEAKQKKESKK